MTKLLLHLCACAALIVETSRLKPYREVRELHPETVVLVEYEYVGADDGTKYECVLRVNGHKNWTDLDRGAIVAQYSKKEKKSSFFFTASHGEFHQFSVYDEHPRPGRSLRVTIYEGRKKDPKIFSSADSHARDLHNKIESAADYCRSISDIQRFDTREDSEFRRCYSSMERTVFYSALLKIATAVMTFYFFNKKMKQFYLSKKIIHE